MTERIGLIAGSGQFPILFAQAAQQRNWQIFAAAYKEETDPELDRHVDHLEWFYVGQINRLIKFFRENKVNRAVMLGAIHKPRAIANIRPDIKALALIARMRNTHDDALLRQFADMLTDEGIQILSSTILMPDLLASPGVWTRRKPTREEEGDIRIGWRIAKEIGRLDIGQCVVIKKGSIMAVEAIDGTDATIERGGRLARGQAVVVKVCKPNQDTRFDVPAVGLQTIETMHAADVKTLAIEAGKALVFDRQAMIEQADAYQMTIIALDQSGFPEKA